MKKRKNNYITDIKVRVGGLLYCIRFLCWLRIYHLSKGDNYNFNENFGPIFQINIQIIFVSNCRKSAQKKIGHTRLIVKMEKKQMAKLEF